MSARDGLIGLGLIALAGACVATASPRRARMSTQNEIDGLHPQPGYRIEDVGGDELAFDAQGERWAAVEGARLHVGLGPRLVATGSSEAGATTGPLRFSPDGRSLSWGASQVTLGADGAPQRFSGLDAELLGALVAELASPAGELEVTASARSDDGTVRVIAGRSRPSIRRGAPSPSPRAVVVGLVGKHGSRTLWSGAPHEAPTRILLSGTRVAFGGSGLLVADVESGAVLLRHATALAGTVNALAFSPRGDRLYTASADGKLESWTLPDGRHAWSRQLADQPLRALAVVSRPAGDLLASCGWDDKLYLLSASAPTRDPVVLPLSAHGEALAVTPAGDRLLVALGGARAALQAFELHAR